MSKKIYIENKKIKAFAALQDLMGITFTRITPMRNGIQIETQSSTIAELLKKSLRLI